MARLNNSLMSSLQSQNLEEKIQSNINEVDLNLSGFDYTNPSETLEKYKAEAHYNRVMLWLSSKSNDYVRDNFTGGILYQLLAKLNNDTNLKEWTNIIKQRFNEEFSKDLEIFYLNLETDKLYKKLIINMIVRDVLNNKTFPVSTEASI